MKTLPVEEYKIIEGTSVYVENLVNWYLKEGWELNGNLLQITVDKKYLVAQGIIKYKK